MTKILLSITIWLRKYQGREGNYYTIANAVSMMCVFIYLLMYGLGYWIGKLMRIENNFVTTTPIPLFVIIIFSIIFFELFINKLRKNNIFIGYKQYKFILSFCCFIGLTAIVLLLII